MLKFANTVSFSFIHTIFITQFQMKLFENQCLCRTSFTNIILFNKVSGKFRVSVKFSSFLTTLFPASFRYQQYLSVFLQNIQSQSFRFLIYFSVLLPLPQYWLSYFWTMLEDNSFLNSQYIILLKYIQRSKIILAFMALPIT